MNNAPPSSARLIGLDIARYLAFIGMVIVNFNVAMSYGVENNEGLISAFINLLQGRAAATFVVLAGIGLGLSSLKRMSQTITVTIKRAIFLLILGLLNMLIFVGDILHYYAFYFLFGVLLLPLSNRMLIGLVLLLNLVFVAMMLSLNYEAGWNLEELSYSGFWTIDGFIRNLFFNGFHPIAPWLGFLLFGILLSRVSLIERKVQLKLIIWGLTAFIVAEVMSFILSGYLVPIDSELQFLVLTEPMPPMPLYSLAGIGVASIVIGLCLMASDRLKDSKIYYLISPAATQTLTLYILHIIVGLGFVEALGLIGSSTPSQAFLAAIIFCILVTIYAFYWSRWFKRGIFESLMRKLTG
tara:strand:+ start:230 stop:1291 length:1062 start_codon:yes stop_codon:yes gene_type:complete